ncbi:proteasome inhibitor PI31 subunit isoform X2 [Pectinophora gossypiella]|uniref:proteasome inhibitor PI31 subunit isoform X2 n=1 Tax=Pectinophora gossypiella TaxID=13191 RepID=UPI00214E8B0F|nr:proteasome inhibitor PI31 subunit isoform X2 [Pectinophora gossypiella]
MTSVDPMFGWDLTFKTVEKDIKRNSDVLVSFIHWNLTKRGFRTIGIGDERTLTGDEEKSELLPAGWNDKENYTLRYVLDGKLFILHGLNTDGNLIVNLMKCEDLAVSNIALKIDDAVKEVKGSIEKMIPNHKDLMFSIRRDLIDTIVGRIMVTTETQTSRTPSSRGLPVDPLRVPSRPLPQPDTPNLWGSVPPGARFDPFGPPGGPMPGRRPNAPDADHLPPPGFNGNDMFM